MLEWYRAGASYETLFDDCAAFLALAADAAGAAQFTWRGRACDPRAAPERLSVADAFSRHSGVDLLASLDNDGVGDREQLAAQMPACNVRVGADDDWSDLFARVLVQCVEPHLGQGRATILYDYPLPEAALARPSARDPRLAERFELYACGVELANGFGELTDPGEQRRRFEADMAERERRYGERYPLDEDFLTALAHMPDASGCALGLDRLVMLATGARDVRDVMWAPSGD
jgi:elongation factor P--(R)-beta-lysine ligase